MEGEDEASAGAGCEWVAAVHERVEAAGAGIVWRAGEDGEECVYEEKVACLFASKSFSFVFI